MEDVYGVDEDVDEMYIVNEGEQEGAFVHAEHVVTKVMYDQLYQQHVKLQQDFNQVCIKYNVHKCSSCDKYRRGTVKCLCGKVYCGRCKPEDCCASVITFVHCDKCGILTCSNCSIDTCAVCDKHVCKRANCIAYVCDGFITNDCRNIVCCESRCSQCGRLFCRECITAHEPCAPLRCSCGVIVYKNTVDTVDRYPVIQCQVCGKLSCDACEKNGSLHRAYHSIIPFIWANDNNHLPKNLPPEVVHTIWEWLMCD